MSAPRCLQSKVFISTFVKVEVVERFSSKVLVSRGLYAMQWSTFHPLGNRGWKGEDARGGEGGKGPSVMFWLFTEQATVIVERWWKVRLSKIGREPRMKHRRYRVYRLVEDLKHRPKEPLELILTQSVPS